MIKLYNKDTGALIGEATPAQLQFLRDQLEEESDTDQDYWLNRAALDELAAAGADTSLMELLWRAIGDGEDIEICWERS